jgi:hypothetical protein
MRRTLLICALILCAFPAAASAASVKLVECAPQARMAMFEARLGARSGSERMQVRFTLLVRNAALHEWRRVAADGLDAWLTSAADVGRYSYAKTVQNLSAPAAYRMVVRFRWLDADRALLARARATSRSCRLPEPGAAGAPPQAAAAEHRRGGRRPVRELPGHSRRTRERIS